MTMDRLAEGVYVETGYPGCNVGAIQTKRGLVCIDTPSYPRDARDWLLQLRRVDSRPVLYVILTNGHGDRVLQTSWFSAPIIAHEAVALRLAAWERRFPQAVADSLLAREPLAGRDLVPESIEQPTLTFTDELTIFNYDSPIQLLHAPGACEGGAIVYLQRDGIVFAGDILVAATPPFLAEAVSADWLDSLALLESLAARGATLVPGRGRLADAHDIWLLQEFILQARRGLVEILGAGRRRSRLNARANDLIELYPLGRLPRNWVRSQYRAGLERMAEEMSQREHAAADAFA